MASPWSIDASAEQFERELLARSYETLLIVDFWAPWCGPCRVLKPILERLVEEYQGRWLLVKVNSDEEPQLAARYGVRGIPNVKAIRRGQVVDEFTGALPEREVRRFIERLIPSEAEPFWQRAQQAWQAGDHTTAEAQLKEALSRDPRFDPARALYIELLIEERRIEEAQALLAGFTDPDAEPVKRLEARLQLSASGTQATLAELQQQVQAHPDDWAARYALAQCYAREGRYEQALEEALTIVVRNRSWNDEAARKLMLQIFAVLDPSDPLVREFRARLASALNR